MFAAAALAVFALGACQDDGQDDGGQQMDGQDQGQDSDGLEVDEDIDEACGTYCEKLVLCNEETEMGECMEKCKGVLYACEQHEKDEAIDQVIQCGEGDCLAFPLCTVNAGIQCVTGLGL